MATELIKEVREFLIDEVSLLRSRVRESTMKDEEALKKASEVEEKLKELHRHLNERERKKEQLKERIKPIVRQKLS